MANDYDTQTQIRYTELFRNTLSELPDFAAEYFRGIDFKTAIRTRYAYAVDIKTFFSYLVSKNKAASISEITLELLDKLTPEEIEIYLDYLSLYTVSNATGEKETKTNSTKAKARKLAAIRSLYRYFYRKGKLKNTPATLLDTPKITTSPIIKLDPNEIMDLLTLVEHIEECEHFDETRRKKLMKTKKRDLAILTLFLTTGIRISELVGIDIDDINFVSNEFSIIRKGGNSDVLVFTLETREALLNYIAEREKIIAVTGDEKALFLSSQRKRITVRAVENMVEKYALVAVPQKHITPHKLRSTYGTMLYSETNDIYLVADVLGHRDVNTTKRHYADISKERRKVAAEVIKLREDKK